MKSRIGNSSIEEDASRNYLLNITAPTSMNSISTNAEENKIKQDVGDEKKEEQKTKVVPIYKLFSLADSTDIILMSMGVAGALANGTSMPLLTVIMKSLLNTLGEETDIDQLVSRNSKVGKFIALTSTFFSGIIIAFSQGWLLTLVMVSVIPIIGICSAFGLNSLSRP